MIKTKSIKKNRAIRDTDYIKHGFSMCLNVFNTFTILIKYVVHYLKIVNTKNIHILYMKCVTCQFLPM